MKFQLSFYLLVFFILFSIKSYAQTLDPITAPSGFSFFNGSTKINDKLYIKATDENHAYTLFTYDGIELTQMPFPDGYPGSYDGYYGAAFEFKNELYVPYSHNRYSNIDLFILEGTSYTKRISMPAGYIYNGSYGKFKDKIYFQLFDNSYTSFLAEFDGTDINILPNPEGYKLRGTSIVYNDHLYLMFSNLETEANHLVRFDGETFEVLPNPEGYQINGYEGSPIVFNNFLYVSFQDDNGFTFLMEFDGEEEHFYPNPAGMKYYEGRPIIHDNSLYIRYRGQDNSHYLAKFDGDTITPISSPAGYQGANNGYFANAVSLNGSLFLDYQNSAGTRVDILEYDGSQFISHPLLTGFSKPSVYGNDLIIGKFIGDYNIQHRYSFQSCVKKANFTVQACLNYISPKGRVLKRSGSYVDVIPSSDTDCDSVINIDLTILQPDIRFVNRTVCDSLVSPSGKYTWKESGYYSDTIENRKGCDRIVNFDLTVHHSAYINNLVSTCASYLSPGGKIYSESGKYRDTLTTQEGCPAYFTTDLEINPSGISEEKVLQLTHGDTINIGGQEVTQTGKYTELLYTQMGCDSLISYQVDFKEPICSDTNLISVTDTLIMDLLITDKYPQENLQIKVYPNPAKDHLFVAVSDLSLSGGMHFEIYNSLNQLKANGNLLQEVTPIDMTPISSSGLYFLKILNDNDEVLSVKKIVIQ